MTDVTIQYKDGDWDKYKNAKVISSNNGILVIKVSKLLTVCISIDNIAYWKVEEVEEEVIT
jgi:hypothetical protein